MKQFLWKHRVLISILIIPYLFIVISSLISIEYDYTAPGDLNPVNSVIEVEQSYPEAGSFNTVSVYTKERVSLLSYLLAQLNPHIETEASPEKIKLSFRENQLSGEIQKQVSITNSLVAAYQSAHYEIKYSFTGVIIHLKTTDSASGFEIGDIITSWEGSKIKSAQELAQMINLIQWESGSSYQAEVLRRNRTGKYEKTPVTVIPTRATQEGVPYLGIYVYEYYTIDEEATFALSPRYSIHKARTLGPSGGLMQALSIYNAITEGDLTKGRKIAGTGTIDVDGSVGPIGGIAQKIYTAHISKADVFFVPVKRNQAGAIDYDASTNYQEAYAAYQKLRNPKMKFVPVATLQEAINWLETHD